MSTHGGSPLRNTRFSAQRDRPFRVSAAGTAQATARLLRAAPPPRPTTTGHPVSDRPNHSVFTRWHPWSVERFALPYV